jgi:hypothetical protein
VFSPTNICTRNLWQKVKKGRFTSSEATTRFPQASCFEKPMCSVPETWGCMCVCVFLSSSRGGLPSDAVLTARQIHPPPPPATSFSRQSPYQPPPGEMLADGCPLGYVYGTATANFVGTIPWSPSDAPPGMSLCDT